MVLRPDAHPGPGHHGDSSLFASGLLTPKQRLHPQRQMVDPIVLVLPVILRATPRRRVHPFPEGNSTDPVLLSTPSGSHVTR